MYRPVSMECDYLFSFQNLKYTFNNGVAELVNGENRDNSSQKSNGSGKSSLLEVISIGLTGAPLRKVKLEEIINDDADEGGMVFVFANDVLKEQLVITRRFFRKSASTVSMQIFRDNVAVKDPLLEQLSSVDEYNKAILDRVGLSKVEVYNNFILSRTRFKNFLDMSDKLKKEAINRFSRGSAVDQAIAELLKDKKSPQAQFEVAEKVLAKRVGQLEIMEAQLVKANEESRDRALAIDAQIDDVKTKIKSSRKSIRENLSTISSLDERANELDSILDDIDAVMEIEATPEDHLNKLIKLIEEKSVEYTHSFKKGFEDIAGSADIYNTSIAKHTTSIAELTKNLNDATKSLKDIESDPEANEDEHIKKTEGIDSKVEKLKLTVKKLKSDLKTANEDRDTLDRQISTLSTKLAGTIECPKCGHKFLAAEEGFDVPTAKLDIEALRKKSSKFDELSINVNEQIKKSEKNIGLAEDELDEIEDKFDSIIKKADGLVLEMKKIDLAIKAENAAITDNSLKIKQIDSKIDAYIDSCFASYSDTVTSMLDGIEDNISELEHGNKRIEGTIEALNLRLEDIEKNKNLDNTTSISEEITKLKAAKRKAEKDLVKRKIELDKYTAQEKVFIDFKTELANSKIEALGDITNDFLESIGSDLRIELSGYSKTAKGDIKEKISVKLLRDGIDAGSFGKFSAGEQARINLATILAMSKLININCDEGKGLDLLVLDEILDSVDESGLANMLSTLNYLKTTSLVVSHGLIAEGYEHRRVVIKENGYSTIN